MKYLKYFYIFISWIIESIALNRWFSCWQFKDTFYFTNQQLLATLTDALNADRGYPLILTRAWHNKVLALLWGWSQSYLQYWDIRFLQDFISLIGAFGIYLAIWYFVTKGRRNIFVWGLLALITIVTFIELYFIPHVSYAWRIIIFGTLFQLLSLYGLWNFLSQKYKVKSYILVTLFMIFSLLFLLLFPLSYQNFCLKM